MTENEEKKERKQSKIGITLMISALIFTSFGFGIGIYYQRMRRPLGNFQRGGRMMQSGPDGPAFMDKTTKPLIGEVISIDDKSITIKTLDSGSKIILFSESTKFIRFQSISKSDLIEDSKVTVIGSVNSDGSMSATEITINP